MIKKDTNDRQCTVGWENGDDWQAKKENDYCRKEEYKYILIKSTSNIYWTYFWQ